MPLLTRMGQGWTEAVAQDAKANDKPEPLHTRHMNAPSSEDTPTFQNLKARRPLSRAFFRFIALAGMPRGVISLPQAGHAP